MVAVTLGGESAVTTVYRLDTSTGAIKTYFMTYPGLVERMPAAAQAMHKELIEGSRLVEGPTAK